MANGRWRIGECVLPLANREPRTKNRRLGTGDPGPQAEAAVASRLSPVARVSGLPLRTGKRSGNRVAQRAVAPSLSDAVELAQIFNTDSDITHASHHIRKCFLHAPEIIKTADQENQSNEHRDSHPPTRSRS